MPKSRILSWLFHGLGLQAPETQTTQAERDCMAKHAKGRKRLVEIGVYQGATTRVLRSVMDPSGKLTSIDPHPAGRLGVSFERLVALREAGKSKNGDFELLRNMSFEAAEGWSDSIDFIFIDGDHSWDGIDRDWKDWPKHVPVGGIIALHDSRPMPDRGLLDSVKYSKEKIFPDPAFKIIDEIDSLTVLERVKESSE